MGSIFKNQTLLTLKLETNLDISTASELKILYRKPDGTRGSWPGTLDGTTKISYDVSANDIDQAGNWQFQAYAKIGTLEGYGVIVHQKINNAIV